MATAKAKATPKTTKSVKTTPKKTPTKASNAKVVPINREDVQKQIETLKSDLATLTKTLKDSGIEYVDAKTSHLRETAVEKGAEIKDKAVHGAELTKEKYSELTAETEARIRANPLTAVAIAAGVGLFLGALSRR